MKIAFISTMFGAPWGGSEELWSQAAIRLSQEGHDVQVSIVYWPRLSNKITALMHHGIKIKTHMWWMHSGPIRSFWNKISLSARRGFWQLRQFSPDLVVISQGHNSGGFDWARICREARLPYVILVHCNCESWWFHEEVSDAVATYTAARRIFCVSHRNLEHLRLQVGEPLLNAEVVRNPFNVSTGPPPAWPDESGVWRLASVARIDLAAKGQDILLQTLARPEWRDRLVELNLFGVGYDEVGLRRLAKLLHLKNVHFRGHVNDVRAIWERNHILILPSRYEGLPLSLVEAMWCARPAVVTDVGGNAELCVDSETGFIAQVPTVPSLAYALQRAWDRRQEWRDLGQAARIRVEDQIPHDPVPLFCEQLRTCAT